MPSWCRPRDTWDVRARGGRPGGQEAWGQGGPPLLGVHGGWRSVFQALQGLPRKDAGPQHPSGLSVPGVRTPRIQSRELSLASDPSPTSAQAPRRRPRLPHLLPAPLSPPPPTTTDHSDRSCRARSRPSEERSGAGGRRGILWLVAPLGRAVGASRAWGRAENIPDRSANQRRNLHCVPARHTPRD